MKLGVCVPYRDREMHLNEFIPKVGKYLKSQDIEFCMYFCHQTDDKLFNRGATKNIAAKHAFEDGCTHIVWHDTSRDGLNNIKFRLYSTTVVENSVTLVVGV